MKLIEPIAPEKPVKPFLPAPKPYNPAPKTPKAPQAPKPAKPKALGQEKQYTKEEVRQLLEDLYREVCGAVGEAFGMEVDVMSKKKLVISPEEFAKADKPNEQELSGEEVVEKVGKVNYAKRIYRKVRLAELKKITKK
jgi:hypothetical protein